MRCFSFSKQALLLFVITGCFACNTATSSESTGASSDTSVVNKENAPTTTTVAIKTTADFVLDGHEVLASQKGDLNGDSYEDVVLILKATNEEEVSDYAGNAPSPRPLLVLTGDAQGSFSLAARNDAAVYCVDCGGQLGDAFSRLIVHPPAFTIEHYGGSAQRWARILTFTFKDDPVGWYLQKDDRESFDATTPQNIQTETKDTLLIPLEAFDIYQ